MATSTAGVRPIVAQVGGFTLPCAPDTLRLVVEGKALSYDFIARGVVQLPRGRVPERYSWSGTLYGEAYGEMLPFLRGRWQDPVTIRDWFRSWVKNGEQDARLLTIAGVGVSELVYCQRATFDVEGAFGNIPYSIEFYEARPFGLDTQPSSARGVILAPTANSSTAVVTARDSWWSVTQRATGDGSLWQATRDLNPGQPRSAPTPGSVVTLPAPNINRRES